MPLESDKVEFARTFCNTLLLVPPPWGKAGLQDLVWSTIPNPALGHLLCKRSKWPKIVASQKKVNCYSHKELTGYETIENT